MTSTHDIIRGFSILPMRIQFGRCSIQSEISIFKEYIIDNSFSIKKFQSSFEKSIENLSFENNDVRDHFENYYAEQNEKYFNKYPLIFKNSTFLTLYSYFETKLDRLCNDFSNLKKDLPKTIDEVKGKNFIGSSKKYLVSVVGINLDDLKKEWSEIQNYQKIRNVIVHNNSNIITIKGKELKQQPIYQSVKNNKYLQLNEETGEFYIFDNDYLIGFCDLIEKYLFAIYSRAESKI